MTKITRAARLVKAANEILASKDIILSYDAEYNRLDIENGYECDYIGCQFPKVKSAKELAQYAEDRMLEL